MLRIIIVVLSLLFIYEDVFAQENPDTSYWDFGGVGNLTISQVSLTNWAAGGQSSVSGNILFNGFVNYNKEKTAWDNFLSMGYGLMKQGEDPVRKTDDKIDFSSKFGYRASKFWYYTAELKFKTQFTEGYNYPNDSVYISRFMAPAYINISLGMDYKPSKHFNVYIAPISGKTTIVNDDKLSLKGAFGVKPGEKVRNEFGGYIKSMYTRDIIENVNLLTRLDLFSNYLEKPQYIDVSWELMINLKVNKYLSANINTHLIYDEDIKFPDPETGEEKSKVQFKEVFGVGLSVKF